MPHIQLLLLKSLLRSLLQFAGIINLLGNKGPLTSRKIQYTIIIVQENVYNIYFKKSCGCRAACKVWFRVNYQYSFDLGSLSEIVRQRRLRFAGHILRLPENRPAYMAMNWQPDNGRRRPRRPTKTWRTTFNEDLHDMGPTWMGAKRSASDRPKRRKLVARCSSRNWRN